MHIALECKEGKNVTSSKTVINVQQEQLLNSAICSAIASIEWSSTSSLPVIFALLSS